MEKLDKCTLGEIYNKPTQADGFILNSQDFLIDMVHGKLENNKGDIWRTGYYSQHLKPSDECKKLVVTPVLLDEQLRIELVDSQEIPVKINKQFTLE